MKIINTNLENSFYTTTFALLKLNKQYSNFIEIYKHEERLRILASEIVYDDLMTIYYLVKNYNDDSNFINIIFPFIIMVIEESKEFIEGNITKNKEKFNFDSSIISPKRVRSKIKIADQSIPKEIKEYRNSIIDYENKEMNLITRIFHNKNVGIIYFKNHPIITTYRGFTQFGISYREITKEKLLEFSSVSGNKIISLLSLYFNNPDHMKLRYKSKYYKYPLEDNTKKFTQKDVN